MTTPRMFQAKNKKTKECENNLHLQELLTLTDFTPEEVEEIILLEMGGTIILDQNIIITRTI